MATHAGVTSGTQAMTVRLRLMSVLTLPARTEDLAMYVCIFHCFYATSLSKCGCSLLTKLLSPLSGLQDLIGTYSCDCLPAYTGDDCDEEVDECQPNPCVNGGTCHVS